MCRIGLFVALAFLAVGPVRATEKITDLERKLYELDFEKATAARYSLMDIAESGDRDDANAASDILRRFDKSSEEWLTSVGNDIQDLKDVPGILVIKPKQEIQSKQFVYMFRFGELLQAFLSGKHVQTEHLAILSQMPELQILDIGGTKVSGEHSKPIVFPSLQVLSVNDSPLSDKGMLNISAPKLKALNLNNTPITNRLLKELSMVDIQSLSVAGTHVDTIGLREIARFPNLRSIEVDLAQLGQETIELMDSKESLSRLVVHCSPQDKKRATELCSKLPIRISTNFVSIASKCASQD